MKNEGAIQELTSKVKSIRDERLQTIVTSFLGTPTVKGSHFTWNTTRETVLTIPFHGKNVKPVYVRKAIKALKDFKEDNAPTEEGTDGE